MPFTPSLRERIAVRLVGTDLRIDADGSIWRLRRFGKPCSQVRAEDESRSGYQSVGTSLGNVWAHRLVYQYFYGDIPDGMYLNHKNGRKTDNRPENLEVVTHRDNHLHRFGVLGQKAPSGERHAAHKLTASAVAAIRRRAAAGEAVATLAAEAGVTAPAIYAIIRGQTWRTAESGYLPDVHVPTAYRSGVARGYKLSLEREAEIVALAATGATHKHIAETFRVSVATVRAAMDRQRTQTRRTTNRISRQRLPVSDTMLLILREVAAGPKCIPASGTALSSLAAHGWAALDWDGCHGRRATITPAGIAALRQLEESLVQIEAESAAHGQENKVLKAQLQSHDCTQCGKVNATSG